MSSAGFFLKPSIRTSFFRDSFFKNAVEHLQSVLTGYSNIFFMSSPTSGAFILLFSFWYSSIGIHGLVAALFSQGYWRWKTRKQTSIPGTAKPTPPFNAILCGTFLGYWMQPSFQSFLFLLAVWYTNLIFHSILDGLLVRKGIPVLSLPFSLTCLTFGPSIQAHRSHVQYSPFSRLNWSGFHLQELWNTFAHWSSGSVFWDQAFQSLGSVIFIPVNPVGAVILTLILFYSRILFLGILGSLSLSWSIHTILYPVSTSGTLPIGFWNWSHFNFALLGASLGGVFFIPSVSTLPFICAGFWGGLVSYYGLLYLFQYQVENIHSFPLCIGTMIGVYLARSSQPLGINQSLNRPMEKVLAQLVLKRKRFGSSLCILDLPLTLPAQILQGFNGPWTHQGRWRYALDFISVNSKGISHENTGQSLSDYLIYEKPVVSPTAGWVVRIEDQAEENPIGKLSFRGNWGNWLLLKTASGFYVLLAHLKKGSFLVKEGSYVTVGQPLAQVGNSGYSPEPHLHLQVQVSPDPNADTIPFHFRYYEDSEKEIQFYQTPQQKQMVHPIRLNQTLQWALNFRPDQEMRFENGDKIRTLRSGLDPKTGYWFFEEVGVPGRAYFWKDDQEFYFFDWKQVQPDSLLNRFSLVLGRIPFALGSTLRWNDSISIDRLPRVQTYQTSRKEKLQVFLSPWKALSTVEYRMESDGTRIYGKVRNMSFHVTLDPWVGIRAFQVDGCTWTRKLPAAETEEPRKWNTSETRKSA